MPSRSVAGEIGDEDVVVRTELGAAQAGEIARRWRRMMLNEWARKHSHEEPEPEAELSLGGADPDQSKERLATRLRAAHAARRAPGRG